VQSVLGNEDFADFGASARRDYGRTDLVDVKCLIWEKQEMFV
jgi:hypothetical protein